MDREKVIQGLEHCKRESEHIDDNPCNGCPYYELKECQQMMADALALLKEQEAKEVEAEVINEIDRLYRCPSCHISMILRKQPYCHSCGQAVKWE